MYLNNCYNQIKIISSYSNTDFDKVTTEDFVAASINYSHFDNHLTPSDGLTNDEKCFWINLSTKVKISSYRNVSLSTI